MDRNENNTTEAQNQDAEVNDILASAPLDTGVYAGPSGQAVGDGMTWIVEGFRFFKRDIGTWILTMVVGFIVAIVLNLIPILGSLISMFITYVWVGGLMLGCQAVYEGKPFAVKYLFAGFQYRVGRLIGLSVIMGLASAVLMFAVMGSTYIQLLSGTATAVDFGVEFWLSLLVAMALMIPIMMGVWFAPVLIVLQDMPILAAIKASFMGCFKNVFPFVVYGIIALLLYILGSIPLLLGLLVVVPVLFISMYTSYRAIYLKPVE
jgi:hypothetical protein